MDTICLTTRQALTGEPNTRNSEVLQHVASCEACSAFSQKLKQFDDKLKSALHVDVPEGLESRILLAQRMSDDAKEIENSGNVVAFKKSSAAKQREYRWMSLAAALV